jgi:uncharacterized protein (DUF1778 family)
MPAIATDRLDVRVPAGLKDRLKDAAAKDHRTMSKYVVLACEERLARDEKKAAT